MLAWAAAEDRVILTHDVSTMTAHAYERVVVGEAMPGLCELSACVMIAWAVEDILPITDCSLPGEWEGQACYLPVR